MGAILFYIITNFGVWSSGFMDNFEGLISCYTLALPFLEILHINFTILIYHRIFI